MIENERKFNLEKDKIDKRDFIFKTPQTNYKVSYSPTDLRSQGGIQVLDQLNLGSCTAFGITQMVRFVRKKQNLKDWQPSPLFTYYTTREIQGTVNSDSGATIRDALKSAVNFGVIEEKLMPYIPTNFKKKPTTALYNEALKHQTLVYKRIMNNSLQDMIQCLSEGFPFVFGILLYSSFLNRTVQTTGVVTRPTSKERLLGGHCMLCNGWFHKNGQNYFIVQNSWGARWGDKGFCYIPFEYMTDTSKTLDLWTIRLQENDGETVQQKVNTNFVSALKEDKKMTLEAIDELENYLSIRSGCEL